MAGSKGHDEADGPLSRDSVFCFFRVAKNCVIIMPMHGFVEIVRKQPYLNYNEQRALESIIERMVSGHPLVKEIVLYGSKARGDFMDESDIDLLFITDRILTRAEKFEISDAVYEAEVENDVVVSVVFVEAGNFWMKDLPFLKQVQREGIKLWSRE